MEIKFKGSAKTETLQDELEQLAVCKDVESIMVLACDKNNYQAETLNLILSGIKKPIFGGVFPSIIYHDQKYDEGFILVGFKSKTNIVCIEKSGCAGSFNSLSGTDMEDIVGANTIITFVDGLASHIGTLIDNLFTDLGLEFNYIGGGAGSLSLKQKPCIITNDGLKQDCAILAGIELESGIGVKHGWSSIAGPFCVTKADGNTIFEIDHEPAFNVYQRCVEEHSGKSLSTGNFFDVAKAYPFGINRIETEKIVRDPISIADSNNLICVGEVKTGTFVDILHGQKSSLISAAKSAFNQAFDDCTITPGNAVLFIDCISRVLYLEDEFKKELEAVYTKTDLPMIGALTIGEIANSGKDCLDFHNKTSVIGCF